MSQRCDKTHPDFGTQCIHTMSDHDTHAGWSRRNERLTWQDTPLGPVNRDEFEAAAWELTGALGLTIAFDPMREQLVVDRTALNEWWETADRRNIVRAWKEHTT